MTTPGTPEHVIAAARDVVESNGDPEFMAFLATALHDYDHVVATERAWVGDWPYEPRCPYQVGPESFRLYEKLRGKEAPHA